MAAVPAHLVATVDQHRAALRDLVRIARDHQQRGCELPGACAGSEVADLLEDLHRDQVATLAFTAIAELALLGNGEHQELP
jgi:hypothetical protein